MTDLQGGSTALHQIRAAAIAKHAGKPVALVISGSDPHARLIWRAGSERHAILSGTRYRLEKVLPDVRRLLNGIEVAATGAVN